MALVWFDSCGDGYTWSAAAPLPAGINQFWTGASGSGGGGNSFPAPATGRNGRGIQISNSNLEMLIWKDLPAAGSHFYVGWAWRKNAGYTGNTPIFGLADTSGNYQVSIYHDGTNFYLYRGNGTTLLATYANALATSTWYYFEVKWIGDQTSGTFEFRINESVVATYSGDTCQQASTTAQRVYFGGDRTQTGTTIIDDVYVCDNSGSVANTYLGDVKVETKYPSGAGNTDGAGTSFDGNDGNQTSNWLLVDEADTPDDDTTYVESSDVGDKDTYAYGDLATATGTVYGVKVATRAEKTDAGSRTMKSVARLSSTEEDSAALSPSTLSYAHHQDIRLTKPGGGQWTISDVNSAEFGFKVDT